MSDDELVEQEEARLKLKQLKLLEKDYTAGHIPIKEIERVLDTKIKIKTSVADLREQHETKARRQRVRRILKEQGKYSKEAVRALMENPLIRGMDPFEQEPTKTSIVIPGFDDVIILPGTEEIRKQMARERAQWYQTHRPASPETLEPVIKLLTKIDDAQDIAYTAMMLMRPILKRIPKEWNNPLSWVLSAIDVAGVLVTIMGSAAQLNLKKLKFHNLLKAAGLSKKQRFKRVSEYKTKINYASTIIQGAQAAETLTGYGLRLGPIMGMISDTVWSGVRALGTGQLPELLIQRGQQIDQRIRKVPLPDIGEQMHHVDEFEDAIKYLTQPIITQVAARQIRPQDHALIMLANMLAIQTVTEYYPLEWVEHRINQIEHKPVPARMHTAQLVKPGTTYADLPGIIGRLEPPYKYYVAKEAGLAPETQQTLRFVERDGANAMFDWWGGPEAIEDVPDQLYHSAGWAVEYGIYPPEGVKPEQVLAWLQRSDELATNTHRRIPERWMIEQAAAQHMGGWRATR